MDFKNCTFISGKPAAAIRYFSTSSTSLFSLPLLSLAFIGFSFPSSRYTIKKLHSGFLFFSADLYSCIVILFHRMKKTLFLSPPFQAAAKNPQLWTIVTPLSGHPPDWRGRLSSFDSKWSATQSPKWSRSPGQTPTSSTVWHTRNSESICSWHNNSKPARTE